MQKKKYILGIESSCDETSVAIVTRNNKNNKPKVLANIVKNQIHVHESFGGVVPELAARAHSDVIDLLVEKALKKAKIRSSLFINPSSNDIRLAKKLNADCIEIHTGKLANLVKSKKNYSSELNRIKKSAKLASSLKIEVHAGHGLDYKTTQILTKTRDIEEYNIGHFIIGESIFYGLSKVIKNFKKIIKK